jgi:protocatechuate 3,4-dioxygenase beta subunit
VLGAIGLAAAGCLSVPDGPTPMCKKTTDCDFGHGEVCDEGVCWGNPPAGTFAAVISPPSTRHDLVPRELPQLPLAPNGWLDDLKLEAPVLLSGRIVAYCPPPMTSCDPTTLGATVTVSRRSQFHGGPGFTAVANVEAGADSFSIPVPRTKAGDDPYTVTIVPDGSPVLGAARSAAEQVPPRRMQMSLPESTGIKPIELGRPDLPVVSGTLTDSTGQPLGGYRVTALGHWDVAAPATEVSTVALTDDATGSYAVTLSADLVGTVELVARPTRNPWGPTIHLANIDATRSSAQRSVATPAGLGNVTTVKVVVTGFDRSGTIGLVRGAQVSVSGVLTSTLTSFTVNDVQVTNDLGEVTLHVLDGASIVGSYRMSITPPASSILGVVFDQKLSLAPAPPVVLAPRVALRGTIVDDNGKPLPNVAVTARPSLRFLWTLDAAPQAFVSAIPAATAVTLDTGEFVVWVDPSIAQAWGHYDLLIEPPTTAQAPTYIKSEVEIPRDGALASVTVGEIALPQAAFVHGTIAAPDQTPVENAELKLYAVSTELALCSEVAHAPTSCPIPAQLQGRNTSDKNGTVRLALPR